MSDYIMSDDLTDKEIEEIKRILNEELLLLIELGIHEYLKEREQ